MPFRQPKLPALEHEFPWGKRHRRSYPLAPLRPASGTAPTVANMCLDFFTVYGLFIIFLQRFLFYFFVFFFSDFQATW